MTTDTASFVLAADVDSAEDPVAYIDEMCERGRARLVNAVERRDIDTILELKNLFELMRVHTLARHLPIEAQLAATEMVRRFERGLALAVAAGQAAGEIKTRTDGGWGKTDDPSKRAVTSIYRGSQDRTECRAMGAVSDIEFEAVLDLGRAERNLSRANVVRKLAEQKPTNAPCDPAIPAASERSPAARRRRIEVIREMAERGNTSAQIGARLSCSEDFVRRTARELGIEIAADQLLRGTHRNVDPNRVVSETVHALEGLAMGVELVVDDLSALDPAELDDWSYSLMQSLRTLNRLTKSINNMKEQDQ